MKRAAGKRECPNCKAEHFPRTDPVVIMLVRTSGENACWSAEQFPPRDVSCLAGFVEAAETIEDAVPPRNPRGIRNSLHRRELGYIDAAPPWPLPVIGLNDRCMRRAPPTRISSSTNTELEDPPRVAGFDRAEATLMIKRQHPMASQVPIHLLLLII